MQGGVGKGGGGRRQHLLGGSAAQGHDERNQRDPLPAGQAQEDPDRAHLRARARREWLLLDRGPGNGVRRGGVRTICANGAGFMLSK